MKKSFEYDGKIEIILPCGCKKMISAKLLEKNGGKWYIKEIRCKEHNRTTKDRFLMKISGNRFKIINDLKKEKKILRDEENFIVEIYSKKLTECSLCDKEIFGKNTLSAENIKRSLWEIEYRCPHCDNVDICQIDENDLN